MIARHLLMCPPAFFGVEYEINPWMRGNKGAICRTTAQKQWHALHRLFTQVLDSTVDLLPPQPGLPDLVFTANAAVIHRRVAVPARFRYCERQREEPHFTAWFTQAGWTLKELPNDGSAFEGAGDALFDTADAALLWAAHGFRTDLAAHVHLSQLLDVEVVSLRLVDPRFYHLDTCFCPLPGGRVLWYPPAFDGPSRALVEQRVPNNRRLVVDAEDALSFACNAVVASESDIVLHRCSEALMDRLRGWGMRPHITPLSECIKAGGAAKCLTLDLN